MKKLLEVEDWDFFCYGLSMNHSITLVCSCGKVIATCKCPLPKKEEIVRLGCKSCQDKKREKERAREDRYKK